MTSLTRVQSSLELLCQTAGALEANDNDAPKDSPGVRVSPTPGGGSRTAQTQSPFGEGTFMAGSRVNSHQYLVGASPSHDSFGGFEEDDDSAVPTRPWTMNDGRAVSVPDNNYMEGLRQNHSFPASFVPGHSASSFQPPANNTRVAYQSTTAKDAHAIYRPTAGGESAHIDENHSLLTLTASSGSGTVVLNGGVPTINELVSENSHLRMELSAKDRHIESLQATIRGLQEQVASLKSLPVGKISQIPVDDLLDLMQEYGSEVSDNALPPRKGEVQKASVVRQFRRWNPSFFEYFEHRNGKWVPKLGKKAELERREQARQEAHHKTMSPRGASRRTPYTNSKRRFPSYK